MYDATEFSVPKQAEKIFNSFLLLYPKTYRTQYENEMRLVFTEMYQEKLARDGKIGIEFWFSLVGDMTQSVINQHLDEIRRKGMKKYLQQTLHINKFNIIGGFFLLPVFLVFCIDIISRIAQGDVTHYNRPVYNFLSHTLLYSYPVLFIWVIIFPLLAILINIIPIVKNISKNYGHIKTTRFFFQNLITIILISFATFFILLIKFHDFGPCMLHGIVRLGLEHFTHIITYCRNA